jgi:hypothetical protein
MVFRPVNVALVIIGTGRYGTLLEKVVRSARQFFLPACHVTYIGLSDTPIPDGLFSVTAQVPCCTWPEPTLWRYRFMLSIADILLMHDYVFYVDADMEFVATVGSEILGDLVGVAQQHLVGTPDRTWPYERRAESAAFIPDGRIVK